MQDFALPDAPIVLEYGQFVVDFLAQNPDLAEKIQGTKACLTGPFTLSGDVFLDEAGLGAGIKKQVFSEPRAIMVDWMVEKFAQLLQGIGKAYSDMGFQIVSMDEPTLSLMVGRRACLFHAKEFIVEQLDKAMAGITQWPSVHVCGHLSPLLRDILLESRAKVLDHEFTMEEKNWELYTKADLENNDKFLAVGVVSTKVTWDPELTAPADYVENVTDIQARMEKAIDLFGPERVIFKPDCGLGGLKGTFPEDFAFEIAMGKLQNITQALKNIEKKGEFE